MSNVSNVHSQLVYSMRGFQALQLIVLVMFWPVEYHLASSRIAHLLVSDDSWCTSLINV